MKQITKTTLERCEFAIAILLTIVLVTCHVIFFMQAGPLWRDEISSLALATKPTLSEFWKSLPLDPFPASYFLLLRLWHAVGLGGSEIALRGLGLLIGLSLIGALWRACYLIDKSAPLWPLALFAFNPLTLEGGASLRPYGFRLIWTVLAFGLLWRVVCGEARSRSVQVAIFAAMLSVQSLFTNAFMLLAIGTGGILVLFSEKKWTKLALIIAIGLIAALTLLPYLPIIHATGEWSKIMVNKNDFASVLAVARDAIADAGTVAYWTWLALAFGLLVVLVMTAQPKFAAFIDLNLERAIFSGTTLLVFSRRG